MMKKIILLTLFVGFAYTWQAKSQVTSFPWTEDFESSTDLPAGWVKVLMDTSSPNDVTITTSQNHTSGGTQSVRFSSYSSANDYNQYLFSLQIHVTDPYTELHFWHKKYNSSNETLEWGISNAQVVDSVHTWTAVSLETDWQEEVVDLSAYVGQDIYIAWHYYGNYLFYVYLDDVSIQEPPSCPAPSQVEVTANSTTEATVTWTANGPSQWNLEYGPTGFTQGSGTQVNGITTTSYHITGLTAGETYDVYVTADCGSNGTSTATSKTWTQPVVENQTCQQAIEIQVGSNDLSTAVITDNTGATNSNVGNPNCANYEGGDLWFYTVVPASGKVAFLTLEDQNYIDTGMAVYDGNCNNLTIYECDDDDGFSTRSKIEYSGTAGDTIYIRTWEYGNNSYGTFKIVALTPPANDNCETATEVASFPFTQNEFALGNFRQPYVNGNDLNGLWYKFTVAQANDSITVSVTPDTDSNTKILIYSGDCANLTAVGNNDSGGNGARDSITFMPADNTTYFVNVAEHRINNPIKNYQISISGNVTLATQSLNTTKFNFYPNPTNGMIQWNANGTVRRMQVTNLTGQVLIDISRPQTNALDISRLPQGVYLLRVRMDGKEGVYRIIKE